MLLGRSSIVLVLVAILAQQEEVDLAEAQVDLVAEVGVRTGGLEEKSLESEQGEVAPQPPQLLLLPHTGRRQGCRFVVNWLEPEGRKAQSSGSSLAGEDGSCPQNHCCPPSASGSQALWLRPQLHVLLGDLVSGTAPSLRCPALRQSHHLQAQEAVRCLVGVLLQFLQHDLVMQMAVK